MWKYIKWFLISVSLVLVLGVAGIIGFFAYLFSDSCDAVVPTPISNMRGDIAEEKIQVCTGFGTVVNYSITLQPRGAGAKTLVQFTPEAGDPKFYWLSDDALTIDLGKVGWIQSPVHRLGNIKITYIYSMGE